MNRYARAICEEFGSNENMQYLSESIAAQFNHHHKVMRFLRASLRDQVDNFIDVIEQELSLSEPLPGVTIIDQLHCFNNQFIGGRCHFIRAHVLMNDEKMPMYVVSDNLPTSRRGLKHHQQAPNDILRTWLGNSGRGVNVREDCAGDITGSSSGRNPYYGPGDNHLTTGIMFCDQSSIGTQNHVEQYENTSYKQALNRGYSHESTPFGVSTLASDARLLQRTIFRRDETGVENGIPRYERRLYNRNLERDIGEGLRNAEKDYMLHGHDMTSINRRLAHKQSARVQYMAEPPNHLRLNHNEVIPENMRYY
jgi:hypothetical protein